jgi:hypothetical protein
MAIRKSGMKGKKGWKRWKTISHKSEYFISFAANWVQELVLP